MRKNRNMRKLVGVAMGIAGLVLIIQTIPIYFWYILLAVLLVSLLIYVRM